MGRLEIVAHRATERLDSEPRRFDRPSIGDRVLQRLDRTALAASAPGQSRSGLTACLRYARLRLSAHPPPAEGEQRWVVHHPVILEFDVTSYRTQPRTVARASPCGHQA